MRRFLLATLLATLSIGSLTGFVLANNDSAAEDASSEAYPVVAQLQLRDRIVTIVSATGGYKYTIADVSGDILSAGLTEEQLANEYPELLDMLRPAVADEGATLMMLNPEIEMLLLEPIGE
ncbi:MAG: hypothetical protein F6K42_37300 [Leptolyngbya sp. SIO1D8]|nr:hypothetical protein [Leptolyngbya sp. SIO1D8]